MGWILLIPLTVSAVWLYLLFKPPTGEGKPEDPAAKEPLALLAGESESTAAVMSVHAVQKPVEE